MSAVAMLAAASCNKTEIEGPQTETPSVNVSGDATEFVAYTESATKTALDGLNTVWVAGDEIGINGVNYITFENGSTVVFEKYDDTDLTLEAPYVATYPYACSTFEDDGEFRCINFCNEIDLSEPNNFTDCVPAIAYSESETTLKFKNITSLIKFQVPEMDQPITEIRISANEELAGWISVDYTKENLPYTNEGGDFYKELIVTVKDSNADDTVFKPGEFYYVPALPGLKTNLTFKINDKVVATGISMELKRNVIHYIATLPTEAKKIYLKPNVWNSDNAWFSAHFWNDKGLQVDSRMEDTDQDGIYEVIAPNGATGVSFCRMNPKFEEFGWNPENVTEENKRVWNQSSDLEIPTNDELYYVVNGWDTGAWKTYEEATAPPVIGLVGSFQGWSETNPTAMTDNGDGWIVTKGVELYKDDAFKFVENKSWDVSFGGKDAVLVAESDKKYDLAQNGQNIQVNKNGRFNLYFNPTTKEFKYEIAEEYTDLMVNITIDNKANWSPLYITLKDGNTVVADNVSVTGNKYEISGEYIGSSLTCTLSNGSKTSDVMNVAITKTGATVTLEETIIKLKVQLNTANAKQWWGNTMKIHVWDTKTSLDTSWPGNTMTSEGNYTWSIIVPSELVGKTIKFLVHNGNGWQSNDSTVTIAAEGNTVTGSSIGIN